MCIAPITQAQISADRTFDGAPVYEINEFGNETKNFTLKIYPFYNPELAKTFTFTVGHRYETAEIAECYVKFLLNLLQF